MRYKRNRRDVSEGPIVQYLRKCGYHVWLMISPCPFDLLVFRPGGKVFVCLEVKAAHGTPTEQQEEFWKWTEGHPRAYVRTPEEALAAVQQWA